MLAACLQESRVVNLRAIFVGWLQFWTSFLLVGFFWALWWSIRIIHKTDVYHRDRWLQRQKILDQIAN
jgi:hypothetical protein